MIHRSRRQDGFTVVELMIATLVFSVILLVITTAVLRFSAAYYRSVRATSTQETARSITDIVSRAIILGSGTYSGGGNFTAPTGMASISVQYFCAGGKVFVYQEGPSYNEGSSVGLVMADDMLGSCNQPEITALSSPQQLLPVGMRLAKLSVEDAGGNLKNVSVVTASADHDLLCWNTGSNCDDLASDSAVASAGTDLQCKPGKGSEYCAVSKLSSVVGKRL